jgi:membrane associated rhomboid family serine protease
MRGHLSVTLILIVINVAFSMAAFNNPALKARFMFNPYAVRHRNEWWRLFTGAFLHADYIHLAFNMLALYSFGKVLEEGVFSNLFEAKAPIYFLGLYFGGLLFADIYSFEKHKNDIWYNSIGASGAVSAVIFSFIMFFPFATIGVFFIPMPAIVFAVLYTIYSIYAGRKGQDNINHGAHMGGAAFGIIYTFIVYHNTWARFVEQIQNGL